MVGTIRLEGGRLVSSHEGIQEVANSYVRKHRTSGVWPTGGHVVPA